MTNSVNPLYYVGFSTATIIASVILFQGFDTDDPANSISLLAGFATTFLGVHLLDISRKPSPALPHANGAHSALESGLMNPGLSIQGRMSIDGWNGAGGTVIGGSGSRGGQGQSPFPGNNHRRGNSAGFRGPQTIFNVLDGAEEGGIELGGDSVGLERLSEVEERFRDEEEGEMEDADERTLSRSARERTRGVEGRGSRSESSSPLTSQGDGRRGSPR